MVFKVVRAQRIVGKIMPTPLRSKKTGSIYPSNGFGPPSIYHALVVIFLEFFSWGLLTNVTMVVLRETFPSNTFLMNGVVQGVKGLFAFLTAPLIGALSDVWGRKFFLLVAVTFTCAPIPLLKINAWWYFTTYSISGLFSVTFSIVFAYVADITSDEDRPAAYGLVSAMFAASLVTSPLIGSFLEYRFSEEFVIVLATAVAVADVLFILICVPESLPENLQQTRYVKFSWDNADPFTSLRKIGHDRLMLVLCTVVFLSYMAEAAEYTCVLIYLKNVIGFKPETVASFIALLGILSVISQTAVLTLLTKWLGAKHTIIVGLTFEALELALFGLGTDHWMMWLAGMVTTVAMICYPALSAYVSRHSDLDQQGVAQGLIAGIRMLCMGLGPALFGFLSYLFGVDLNESSDIDDDDRITPPPLFNSTPHSVVISSVSPGTIPGPPFLFYSVMVTLAIVVAMFLPDEEEEQIHHRMGGGPSIYKRSTSPERHHYTDTGGHTSSNDEFIDSSSSLSPSTAITMATKSSRQMRHQSNSDATTDAYIRDTVPLLAVLEPDASDQSQS